MTMTATQGETMSAVVPRKIRVNSRRGIVIREWERAESALGERRFVTPLRLRRHEDEGCVHRPVGGTSSVRCLEHFGAGAVVRDVGTFEDVTGAALVGAD